jgi:hypothetical protein
LEEGPGKITFESVADDMSEGQLGAAGALIVMCKQEAHARGAYEGSIGLRDEASSAFESPEQDILHALGASTSKARTSVVDKVISSFDGEPAILSRMNKVDALSRLRTILCIVVGFKEPEFLAEALLGLPEATLEDKRYSAYSSNLLFKDNASVASLATVVLYVWLNVLTLKEAAAASPFKPASRSHSPSRQLEKELRSESSPSAESRPSTAMAEMESLREQVVALTRLVSQLSLQASTASPLPARSTSGQGSVPVSGKRVSQSSRGQLLSVGGGTSRSLGGSPISDDRSSISGASFDSEDDEVLSPGRSSAKGSSLASSSERDLYFGIPAYELVRKLWKWDRTDSPNLHSMEVSRLYSINGTGLPVPLPDYRILVVRMVKLAKADTFRMETGFVHTSHDGSETFAPMDSFESEKKMVNPWPQTASTFSAWAAEILVMAAGRDGGKLSYVLNGFFTSFKLREPSLVTPPPRDTDKARVTRWATIWHFLLCSVSRALLADDLKDVKTQLTDSLAWWSEMSQQRTQVIKQPGRLDTTAFRVKDALAFLCLTCPEGHKASCGNLCYKSRCKTSDYGLLVARADSAKDAKPTSVTDAMRKQACEKVRAADASLAALTDSDVKSKHKAKYEVELRKLQGASGGGKSSAKPASEALPVDTFYELLHANQDLIQDPEAPDAAF